MKRFFKLLGEVQPRASERQWLYVPYDQLSAHVGPLAREAPESLGIILIENIRRFFTSPAKPYSEVES